jgi:adenine-specific DNA-methyltransferase
MPKNSPTTLRELLLSITPIDGTLISNAALLEKFLAGAKTDEGKPTEARFEKTRDALIDEGVLLRGKGRGGSVRLANPEQDGFSLKAQAAQSNLLAATQKKSPTSQRAIAASSNEEPSILSYRHGDKRKNNPQVGLVNEANDPATPKTEWKYDPHIDPSLAFDSSRAYVENLIDDALASGDLDAMRTALESLKRADSPYLNWAGKAERSSFDIDTVSLHVHERVDPMSILAAVRKQMKESTVKKTTGMQAGLFEAPFENLPLRDAIDFYKHERGWANRLIAGDSLLVMNSLLQKESMAGQVQMIFFDPPYGIKYGSNFQPFVGKSKVKDRTDSDLTQEPEMIKAFRDTWELGIHSYLTYLRDRILLAHDLLSERGSIFVQISDENLHHVKEVLGEVFGRTNQVSIITMKKTGGMGESFIDNVSDYLLWFAKDKSKAKFNALFLPKELGVGGGSRYNQVELADGEIRSLSSEERDSPELIPAGARAFLGGPLTSETASGSTTFDFEFQRQTVSLRKGGWKTGEIGMSRLIKANRLRQTRDFVNYKMFVTDFPAFSLTNLWSDTMGTAEQDKVYVVQTTSKVLERCMLMTTDPGDLVFDPTCGSGTTAFVAEKWGRRWITCDTSRVATTLAKQRLMTSSYDYYELRYPSEGLRGGFIYKTIPHVTLGSIANNADIDGLYEKHHPLVEKKLAQLNIVLSKHPSDLGFLATEGARKGEKVDFRRGATLYEWEVPFAFPENWPEVARSVFEEFHLERRRLRGEIDNSISAHAESEVLYDQPEKSKTKLRVTGPFSVEAVPSASVLSLEDSVQPNVADAAIARSGETSRQNNWRDELLKTGIRGKGGQILKFSLLETLPSTQCLQAVGALVTGERVVVSFGPEHAALEQRQVEHAIREAGELFPLPKMIVFCAFAFDPEAAKDIDAYKGITALKAQMNTDLLTEDLKKARSSNQSFWLMGQPDTEAKRQNDGTWIVEVNGFDYFDTVKGELVSGGKSKIAMWLLDTDYDDRSLFPRQVFFPMAGKDDGWKKLKKAIRAELDESLLSQFHGTVSLPFEAGDNKKVAVKIVDDRGIESLKIIPLIG